MRDGKYIVGCTDNIENYYPPTALENAVLDTPLPPDCGATRSNIREPLTRPKNSTSSSEMTLQKQDDPANIHIQDNKHSSLVYSNPHSLYSNQK